MMVRASSPKRVLFKKTSGHKITTRRRPISMTKYQITVLKFDQITFDQICPTNLFPAFWMLLLFHIVSFFGKGNPNLDNPEGINLKCPETLFNSR